jgi:Na+/proline symporter
MIGMIKNGLFLASIGFLIVLYSLNPNSMVYDLYSMVTGVFLIGLGGFFFFKGKKKEEADGRKK